MGGAAIAEEALFVGIGAEARDSRIRRCRRLRAACRYSPAGRTWRGPSRSLGRKKRSLSASASRSASTKSGPDFVGRLADRRAEHGDDLVAPCAEPLHGVKGSLRERPSSAPRQPAWAAPMTPACGSANRTGPQSAVVMPSAMPRHCGRHAVRFRPLAVPGRLRRSPHRANGPDGR